MRASVWLLLLAPLEAKKHKPLPQPQRRFTARVETIAHQLNASSEYPPYKRYLTVHYDFEQRRARFDYDPLPHMPPKSFVRRYDLGFEWMVMEIQSQKECQKSKLREAMPMPRYPDHFVYLGQTHVRGQLCDHWRENHGEETVEYFESTATGYPVRMTTEAVESLLPKRVTTPLMTYDFFLFNAEPPDEEVFKMKSSSSSPIFATDASVSIGDCERVVQDMGFPYIHFGHTYYYA
ncbi:hypothetical protein AB1Y20_014718 [Prymnesium parvum]|uniref:Mannosyltransferase n=1 Tax=Prymnesium parvum TaxID=97485 RepID=A0AB34IE98_PRYPA